MKCQVLVDWLTFSVKEQDPAKVIREYLGLDPELFQDAGYGLLGYNRVLRFSDICVCYAAAHSSSAASMIRPLSSKNSRTLSPGSRPSQTFSERHFFFSAFRPYAL